MRGIRRYVGLTFLGAAGRELTPDRARGSRRRLRAFRFRALATLALAGALTWAVVAVASHGSAFIDLTTAGAGVQHNTAAFVQGGIGAGTGNFDPFLTMSGGQNDSDSNPGTEKGYNTTSASGEFETFFGGGRTHPIRASAIPAINVDPPGDAPPGLYREFSLDANDQGSDDFMSIDELKVFLDSQDNLTGYTGAGFTSDVSPFATLRYDMDAGGDTTVLMRSQSLTPGSGVSDITVLLPDSAFPAGCFYGAPVSSCDQWVYFYTASGFAGTSPPDANDYNVTAGFEEWRTRLIPVVNLTKTANTSLDRSFDWTVQKLVSTDDNCLTGFEDANTALAGLNINLFNGQSDTVCWKIIADRGNPTDSNQQVSGTITITNPTGGVVIEDRIPATINSVSDIVTQGGSLTATVVCPVTFPHTLAAGGTLTCTYSRALSSSAVGTNQASAVVEFGTPDLTYSSPAVAFNPAAGPINLIDESASLDDNRGPAFSNLNGDRVDTYTETFTCGADAGLKSNTATLIELDTNTQRTDPAHVNITCHTLSVSKDATPTYTRTFDWTVKKYVSTDDTCAGGFVDGTLSIDLFFGSSDTVCWKIVSDRGDPVDSAFKVTGTITIQNSAPIPANGVVVTDSLAGPVAATVDCDPVTPGNQSTVDVPASSSKQCTYEAFPTNATDRLNTATATLFGQNYSGTALADFGDPTTVIDESSHLDDSRTLPGAPLALSGDDTRTYTESLPCGSSRTESNLATLTEDDSSQQRTDPAAVQVTCHGLSVTKDATPTYTRTFDWTVKKYVSTDDTCAGGFVDGTLNITLFIPQSETVCWQIVSDRGDPVDSAFKVTGTIRITNNAPIPANGVVVSDSLAGPVAATVDCDPVTPGNQSTVDVPASSFKECTYEAFPTNATDRLNTATASLFGQNYTGTALADFGDPTTVIDESAHLDDSRTLPGAPLALSGDDTRTYTESLPCGSSRTETNLATLTEDDSSQQRTDPAAVNLTCVPPPDGCTPGFWKNHTGLWDQSLGNNVTTTIQTFDLFNATFGVTQGFSGLFDTRNLLYALDVSTSSIDVPGLDSNLAALDRHAAAALVNADASGVNYEFTVAQVIAIYQDAVGFVGGSETISTALAKFQTANERGCPLS